MGYYGHSAIRCDGSGMLMDASLAHALLACLQAPGGMGRHLVYGYVPTRQNRGFAQLSWKGTRMVYVYHSWAS